ncbi:TAXI family TRAP transporter solute-binding subunit [Amorphus orientalis]|uniref:TRAP transporter TAXI family solute receptor n=1 Tax=Amorphus orientalis TaxID=649198 RepID=A0AAE4AUH6_9HYPH|nr:TAXI family TRAP transporter solute-binding subunit [Amorphus orientalis]MDQ0317415.1 TRAP transporter TAXI family solute receptor [Amorphus orientalis]
MSRIALARTFVVAAALAGLTVVASAQSSQLRFGAGQQGSQNYGVNAALGQAIGENTDLDVTVQAFGGPTAYLPLVNEGRLDIAAVVTPDFGDAVRGSGPFDGNAQENLRFVAALFPSPVGLMVAADSGIESISDLEGKRVAWGMPAQASLQPYIEGSLANGGLTPDDVTQVPVASVGNGVQALVSGNVDATLFALRAGKVVEADAALGGVRWLPYDPSPEAVERMQATAPEAYLVDVAADGKVVGVEAPMQTMAYDYVLTANADVPDEVITQIVTLLRDKGPELGKSNKVLGQISAENLARPYPSLPQHPAAAKALGAE